MQNILSKQHTHEMQRQESIQRVTQLKQKLAIVNKEVQEREKENKQLTSDLVSMERSQNINPSDKNSIMMEKDMLRREISQISDSIIAKTEEVRTLNCYYQSLQKEHQELDQTCARLKSKEEIYDKVTLLGNSRVQGEAQRVSEAEVQAGGERVREERAAFLCPAEARTELEEAGRERAHLYQAGNREQRPARHSLPQKVCRKAAERS